MCLRCYVKNRCVGLTFFKNPLLKSAAVITGFPSTLNILMRIKCPSLQYTRKHLLDFSYSTQPGDFFEFDVSTQSAVKSRSLIFTRRLCQCVDNHLNEYNALYKLYIYFAVINFQLMKVIDSGTFGAENERDNLVHHLCKIIET